MYLVYIYVYIYIVSIPVSMCIYHMYIYIYTHVYSRMETKPISALSLLHVHTCNHADYSCKLVHAFN